MITMDNQAMALHTIREADLKTHVDKDGWNSDINYEDYLCRKIYENKLNNIKLKYKIDKDKKEKRQKKIGALQIQTFLAVLLTIGVFFGLHLFFRTVNGRSEKDKIVASSVNYVMDSVENMSTEEALAIVQGNPDGVALQSLVKSIEEEVKSLD